MGIKYLAAFDYDHTVVDDNTDIVVRNLIDPSLISDSVKSLYKHSGWINYMQEIFNLLHKHGKTASDIESAVRNIPETPGMTACFEKLASSDFEIIIVSDSNSVFIDTWNQDRISRHISTIFTNPASFDPDGRLILQPYHHQTHCTLSSENLCKGQILEDFVEARRSQGQTYESIYYIGDGRNDICPMLRLGENDFACPRVGYSCEKDIEEVARKVSKPLSANMFRWSTGHDLLEFILDTIEQK